MADHTLIESTGAVSLLNEMLSLTLVERAHATNVADTCRERLSEAPSGSMEYDMAYLGAYETSRKVGELTADVEALKRIVGRLENMR